MDLEKTAAAVRDLLTALDVDEGEHSEDTPERVARAWSAALGGYEVDPARHLARTFPAPPDAGLVIVSGIRVRSTCAHHMLPIVGTATVAYRPAEGARIVGLSKLARVLGDYAARLQVQERLGYQVAATVQTELEPIGAACIITAEHGCMTMRGVQQSDTRTTTHALTGRWREDLSHPDVVAVLNNHRGDHHGR